LVPAIIATSQVQPITCPAIAAIVDAGCLQEFLTATVFLGKLQRRENLMAAFQHFDNDDSGYITEEELLLVSCWVVVGDGQLPGAGGLFFAAFRRTVWKGGVILLLFQHAA
jgi:hypothetical protein